MWEIKTEGERVLVPPGISVRPVISGREIVRGGDSGGEGEDDLFQVELQARYDSQLRRYVLKSLSVTVTPSSSAASPPSAPAEVTGVLLRSIPVQRLLRDLVANAIVEGSLANEEGHLDVLELALSLYAFPEPFASEVAQRKRERWVESRSLNDPETLEGIAAVYAAATLANDGPIKAVAKAFGLQERTAYRWVRRARESGHLSLAEGIDDGVG